MFKNIVNIDFDLKIWLDTTFTSSINRASKENKYKYSDYFMWMHRQHFSTDNPKAKVDIILITDETLKIPPTTYVDLKNNPNSINNMKWLYESKNWEMKEEGLYVETDKDFTMTTKVKFNPIHQFDQCGLCVRIDEDNWLKTSIEYELNNSPKLGAVVTNLGYSDWSTQ